MGLISADRFNELKARVKAECERRAYSGSVESYGGSDYDYITAPASGILIKQEHRDKIAVPLNAINSDTIPVVSEYSTVLDEDLLVMEAFTTVLEKRVYSDHEGTDCSGGCTGMCYGCQGTCYDSCTGCTGSCSGGCKGGCSGCGGECGGGCGYTCSNSCSGGCGSKCTGSCLATCADSCSYGCGSYCTANAS